ncbi:MAG: HypC/HybG/HupF family hydrogenase formation chaperone [Gemmatimonadales bacterium]|nr:HypC/HybG/HupF family hydrogenase formation chaperone [Gemmatimonadales bacterium]
MNVKEDGLALCADAEGRPAEVEVDLIDRVAEGDVILVHAGVALVRVGGTEKGLS